MGQTVVVTQENFATEVLAASQEKVVLIDFFATWCGPCQILKPILQGLLAEYDFVLATVDIDQNPELANEYGVEGVPDVRFVTQGKVIPGFVGVLEESKIRDLLDNLHVASDLDELLATFYEAKTAGDFAKAKNLIDKLFAKYPKHPKVTIAAAEFLIALGKTTAATRMLNTISVNDTEYFAIADNMRGKLFLQEIVALEVVSELDEKYVGAAKHALVSNYDTALASLLEIVEGDRRYQDDGARKAMIVIFNLLGKTHPTTQKFQQQLMMTLY